MRDLSAARRAPLLALTPGVRPLPFAQRWILRGGEQARQAADAAFGLALPTTACRVAAEGERAALWLGPDEWLLIAAAQGAAGTAAALEASLADSPHSLVDVSHRQLALELTGRDAPTLLAAGCPLDLDANAFPV